MIRVQPKPYDSADSALAQTCLELNIDGNEVILINAEKEEVKTKELMNYQLIFEPNYNNMIMNPVRNWQFRKSVAEFLWYMTGNDSVEPILPYFKNWNKYQTNGIVNSNYGVRWKEYVYYVINELKNDKHSRRACINMFDVTKNDTFYKDTCCTIFWQFMIRDNKLHMTVDMRSNDIWYGFSNDQFNNSLFHQLIFNELSLTYPDLELGQYIHNATSLHSYEKITSSMKLGQTWQEYQNMFAVNNNGSRFEIPNDITFSNFWESDYFMTDFAEEFNHFKKYIK
jgi:thymidylate synthase